MDSESRYAKNGPLDANEFGCKFGKDSWIVCGLGRFGRDDDTTGQGEVTIEPGVPDTPSIRLYSNCEGRNGGNDEPGRT